MVVNIGRVFTEKGTPPILTRVYIPPTLMDGSRRPGSSRSPSANSFAPLLMTRAGAIRLREPKMLEPDGLRKRKIVVCDCRQDIAAPGISISATSAYGEKGEGTARFAAQVIFETGGGGRGGGDTDRTLARFCRDSAPGITRLGRADFNSIGHIVSTRIHRRPPQNALLSARWSRSGKSWAWRPRSAPRLGDIQSSQ